MFVKCIGSIGVIFLPFTYYNDLSHHIVME